MKLHWLRYFKNKYVFTTSLFLVYILFLDDVDIFYVVRQEVKLNHLKKEKEIVTIKYKETKNTLDQLYQTSSLEKYAREHKLFKKDDEDIFVITYDGEE